MYFTTVYWLARNIAKDPDPAAAVGDAGVGSQEAGTIKVCTVCGFTPFARPWSLVPTPKPLHSFRDCYSPRLYSLCVWNVCM